MMIGPLTADKGGTAIGGLAVHTTELSDSLAKFGLKVYVVTNTVSVGTLLVNENPAVIGIPAPRLRDALRYFGAGRHLPGLISSVSRSYSRTKRNVLAAAYAEVYLRVMENFDFDVVHTHLTGPPLEGAHLAAKSMRKPLVVTVHSLRGTLGEKYVREVTLPSLEKASHIITVSRSLERQLNAMKPGLGPITTVHGGFNRSSYFPINRAEARAQLGLRRDGVHILFVGNIVPVKSCDTLITAFAQLRDSSPNAELHFVGAPRPYTDSGWLDRLMRLPGELGVESAVHFHGDVKSNRSGLLRLWYSSADCTVLPSIDEGFGLALLESMACNTPVIASSVGGILDLVEHEQNGLTFPAGDAEALCASMRRLVEDDELRTVITGNLSRTAERFSWEQSAQQVSDIYHMVQATCDSR